MKINFDNKNFELKFGFGVFFILGKMWKLEGINAVFTKVFSSMKWAADIDFSKPELINLEKLEIPFETFTVLADLITASMVANKENNVSIEDIDTMELCDWVFNNQEEIQPIMTAFVESMPKAKPETPGK